MKKKPQACNTLRYLIPAVFLCIFPVSMHRNIPKIICKVCKMQRFCTEVKPLSFPTP